VAIDIEGLKKKKKYSILAGRVGVNMQGSHRRRRCAGGPVTVSVIDVEVGSVPRQW